MNWLKIPDFQKKKVYSVAEEPTTRKFFHISKLSWAIERVRKLEAISTGEQVYGEK